MNKFSHINGMYFEINNADVYYEITGNDKGHPLLFLHGGMQNIESFNGILKYLPDEFKFIGIDSRGQGASTFKDELSYEILCNDVKRLLSILKLSKIDIIGHSDGGIVAMKLAESNPELVSSLVLLGTRWCLENKDPVIDLYESITPGLWLEKFKDDIEYYERINKQPRFNELFLAIKEMWLNESDNNYPKDKVKNIKCETLIIHGDDDFLVSCEHSLKLAKMIQKSHFANIPFCNHAVHEENPEIVSSLIIDFYRKLDFLS